MIVLQAAHFLPYVSMLFSMTFAFVTRLNFACLLRGRDTRAIVAVQMEQHSSVAAQSEGKDYTYTQGV